MKFRVCDHKAAAVSTPELAKALEGTDVWIGNERFSCHVWDDRNNPPEHARTFVALVPWVVDENGMNMKERG